MSRLYLKSVSLLAPGAVTTAQSGTSAVINLAELPQGDLVLEIHAKKPAHDSGHSLTGKWMEADTEEGPFADSGLEFAAVAELADVAGEDTAVLNSIPLRRADRLQYGYYVGTPAGTLPSIVLGASLIAFEPQD